ncbi:MAG: DUF2490 domain-containing protein [Allosphingosinicella sp.]
MRRLGTLRHGFVAAVLALVPAAAAAKDDAQLWTGGNLAVKLGGGFQLSQEVTARFSDRRGLYEIESNTLVGYKLAPRLTLWAGYTHDPLYDHGHSTGMEHRAREQLTLDRIPAGPGALSLRLRLEQRWREGSDGTGWRARPYFKYSLPLGRGGTALAFSHESFLNLNHTAFQGRTGEDRMRNALAISAPLAKGLTAEIGYLNQHSFVPGGPDTTDHVATVTLNLSL